MIVGDLCLDNETYDLTEVLPGITTIPDNMIGGMSGHIHSKDVLMIYPIIILKKILITFHSGEINPKRDMIHLVFKAVRN